MYPRGMAADFPQSKRPEKEPEGSHRACCDLASEATPSTPPAPQVDPTQCGGGVTWGLKVLRPPTS